MTFFDTVFIYSVDDYISSDWVLPSSVQRDDVIKALPQDQAQATSESQPKVTDLNQVSNVQRGFKIFLSKLPTFFCASDMNKLHNSRIYILPL
jgi:hypothetical protein